MANVDIAFVNSFTDSRGKQRHVFRRKGFKKVTLPGALGSRQFLAAYEACLAGGQPIHKTAPALRAGTLAALINDFYKTQQWRKLKPRSQALYRRVFVEVCGKIGAGTVADMPRSSAIKVIHDIGARAPALANVAISALKTAFEHAIDVGLRKDGVNPFRGIKKYKGGEHHCWTDEEIAKFEARWPVGTRQRTAYELLLNTSQRVGDVGAMTTADIKAITYKDGKKVDGIACVQEKTGTKVWIPITKELATALKAFPPVNGFLLPQLCGKQASGGSVGDIIDRAADRAGLPSECVPHGLRKAACRRMAEAGVNPFDIMAISGHKSLKEIERYTKAADQPVRARRAIESLAA